MKCKYQKLSSAIALFENDGIYHDTVLKEDNNTYHEAIFQENKGIYDDIEKKQRNIKKYTRTERRKARPRRLPKTILPLHGISFSYIIKN